MRHASIFVALIGLVSAGAAEACRCVRPIPASAYRQASAVLLGTVREWKDVSRHDRSYRIEVERSWKQPLRGTIVVHSARTSCLADLKPGATYLIYVAADASGVLRTSACQGNQAAADAKPALDFLAGQK